MNRRRMGLALAILGLLVVVISLAADVIGIGTQPGIIGWKQILGAGVGLIVVSTGVSQFVRGPTTRNGP